MGSKVKMRCARCGKSFKSSGSKDVMCPECTAVMRKERAQHKAGGAGKGVVVAAPPEAPRISGPGAGILVPGLAQAEHPTPTAPATSPAGPSAPAQAASAPKPRTTPRPPAEPKPRREPPPPFVPTEEQRAAIEARYLELAQPVEFDGIRTRIAQEMNVPKTAVKQVVHDLRTRMQLPSWWELRGFTGDEATLQRIREAYLPHLPLPPVGVHKLLAEQLGMESPAVYQAISRIRAELRLPRYNPPELHGLPPHGQAEPQTDTQTEPQAAPVAPPESAE